MLVAFALRCVSIGSGGHNLKNGGGDAMERSESELITVLLFSFMYLTHLFSRDAIFVQ